jgi:hypothetical protein
MKKIVVWLGLLFIVACFTLSSCRTSNILYPTLITQTTCGAEGMRWSDKNISFYFELNDAFWCVTIQNKTDAAMNCLWDKAVCSVKGENESTGTTKKMPVFNRTAILPGTKIQRVIFPRYAVRKYIYGPKEIEKAGSKSVSLIIPIEVNGATNEYEFSFVVSIDKENRYLDELYVR